MFRVNDFGDLLHTGGANASVCLPFNYTVNCLGTAGYNTSAGVMRPLTWNPHAVNDPLSAPAMGGYPQMMQHMYIMGGMASILSHQNATYYNTSLEFDWGVDSTIAQTAGGWDVDSRWAARVAATGAVDNTCGLLQSFSVAGPVGTVLLVDHLASININVGYFYEFMLHPTTIQSIYERPLLRGSSAVYCNFSDYWEYELGTPAEGAALRTYTDGVYMDTVLAPNGELVRMNQTLYDFVSSGPSTDDLLAAETGTSGYTNGNYGWAEIDGGETSRRQQGKPEVTVGIMGRFTLYDACINFYDVLAVVPIPVPNVAMQVGLVNGEVIKVARNSNLGLIYLPCNAQSGIQRFIGSIRLAI